MWSSVPQLRWHALWQSTVTVVCLAAMGALFWYQPDIVRYAHRALLGTGFVPGEYEKQVLGNYFTYGWWSLAFAWGGLEVTSFFLVLRYKAKPNEYPEFQARLERLSEKEGISPPTLVILRGMGRLLNAAATQSFFSGRKVILMGGIVETLTDEEEDYVAAHELRHVSGPDIFMKVLVVAGNGAIGILKWVVMTSMVYDIFTHGWRAFVFLLTAWGVLWVTHNLYKLFAAAHSRSREYAADIGAVENVGWEDRKHLITGLARIAHAVTGWRPFKIFHPKDGKWEDWFESHPSILRRAQVLQLNPQILADGNVRMDGVTVAA